MTTRRISDAIVPAQPGQMAIVASPYGDDDGVHADCVVVPLIGYRVFLDHEYGRPTADLLVPGFADPDDRFALMLPDGSVLAEEGDHYLTPADFVEAVRQRYIARLSAQAPRAARAAAV
jgi:hypothetical protein